MSTQIKEIKDEVDLEAVMDSAEVRPRDVYDDEVERLTKHPKEIFKSWAEMGPLFGFVSPSRQITTDSNGCGVGCLTMVHSGPEVAFDPSLTDEIRRDNRLPKSGGKTTPDHLPVLAEWNRRLDKHFNRQPPDPDNQ